MKSDRVAVLLFCLVCLVGLTTRRPTMNLDLRWDGGTYYVLGTSLAQGNGYRLLNEPGQILANKYPPGWPVVIGAHQQLLGTDDPSRVGRALAWTQVALATLWVLGSYGFARRFVGPGPSSVVASLCLFSFATRFYVTLGYSDISFCALCLAFLLCRDSRLAGLLAAAAFATRLAGLAALGAWALDGPRLGWRHRSLRLALALLPWVGWNAYVGWVETRPEYHFPAYIYQRHSANMFNVSAAIDPSHVDPYDPDAGRLTAVQLARRVAENLLLGLHWFGTSLSAEDPVWRDLFGDQSVPAGPGLLGLLSLPGLALLWSKGEKRACLFFGLSALLIGTTPEAWFRDRGRYVLPLCPVLATSLMVAWQRTRRPLRWGAALAGGALLLSLHIRSLPLPPIETYERLGPQGLERVSQAFPNRSLEKALDHLRTVGEPTDVVVSGQPGYTYLRTGHLSVLPPFLRDGSMTELWLESVPARYVLVDDWLRFDRYAQAAIQAHPERWRLLYEGPEARLYESRSRSTDVQSNT